MKHKGRGGKQYRLRPEPASAVEQWAALTGKSESEVASLCVTWCFAMLNDQIAVATVKGYLAGLCEVEKVRRVNAARLREAQKRVSALKGGI